MKRRGHGEGSIRERSNGRWEARYRAVNGRPRSLYAATRREAVERLRTALGEREQGIRPLDQRLTVAAFLDDWLVGVQQRLRPRTAQSYSEITRLHVAPAVGDVPIARLGPEHVARMLAILSKRRDLSPTTVRHAYSVFRIALQAAVRQGKVHRNVATLVDPPRRSHKEMQPLTLVETRRFLEGVRGDALEALYVTAVSTGLRQGELLALRWQDIDLKRGELAVRHTLQRFSRTMAPTKTDRSRRTIRLPRQANAALATHRERSSVQALSGLVFTTEAGAPLDSANVTRSLQRTLRRLGLPKRRFHDLRHTFATLAIEAGEDLASVSRALGHSSVATTADVYMHVTPAMQDRLAARIEAALSDSA